MSFEFTKENMNIYFKELGKIFRKLNGTKMRAEIVLAGGGAVLANYQFRDATTDIDAVIRSSSVMKEAISRVSDIYDLPYDWLNEGFKETKSYSDNLEEVSVYYKTFSNILEIRTVTAEYLIAMKLMSGRRYKNDLSDIAGILMEHRIKGSPISKKSINSAIKKLYGEKPLPEISYDLLNELYKNDDYENVYKKYKESEKEAREYLLEFTTDNVNELEGENINTIIEMMRQRRNEKNDSNNN